jgi:hypothetical protein
LGLNYQKTIIDGFEYELVAAEVVDVDYFGENREKLYSVTCKMLAPYGSQATRDVVTARPLDANIKNIPIKGEVVFITKGPTAYNSAGRPSKEYYYTNPVSIQSSVHHNGIPGVTSFLPDGADGRDKNTRDNASDGITNKVKERLQLKDTIDSKFGERIDVYPIQPYPGDVILEGRFGNSIRLGSTIDETRNYPVKPHWKSGLGAVGNPVLIISNGTNPTDKPFNDFIQEEIDKDDSTIWMTSGQAVKFTPGSEFTPSVKNRSVDLHNKNEFAGNQIIISSDRLILNSKKQETAIFSAEGIGLSSMKGIAIDGKDVIEMESSRVNIGVNAVHPVLLGDVTMNWLADLCDLFYSALGHIAQETHTSNTGPTGPPINAGAFTSLQGKVKSLRSKIKKLPSDLVFVNEKGGGPKSDAAAEAKDRSKNNEGYVKPMPSEQDLMSTSDYLPQTEKIVADPTNVVTLTAKIDDIEKQKQKILEDLQEINSEINNEDIPDTVPEENTANETVDDELTDFTLDTMIPDSKNQNYPNGITFRQLGISDIDMVSFDEEGNLNYEGDIDLRNSKIPGVDKLMEIPVPFGKVGGKFDCSGMGLVTLKNSPYSVIDFDASDNNLDDLIDGPEIADKYKVDSSGLVSLEGGPTIVNVEFSAKNNNLTNLVGGPTSNIEIYRVEHNKKLTSLKGLKENKSIGYLFIQSCNLTNDVIKRETRVLTITNTVSIGNQISNKPLDHVWIKENWDGTSDGNLKVLGIS